MTGKILYRAIGGHWYAGCFPERGEEYIANEDFKEESSIKCATLDSCLSEVHQSFLIDGENYVTHSISEEPEPIHWIDRPPWEKFQVNEVHHNGNYFWVRDEMDQERIVQVIYDRENEQSELGFIILEIGSNLSLTPNEYREWFPVAIDKPEDFVPGRDFITGLTHFPVEQEDLAPSLKNSRYEQFTDLQFGQKLLEYYPDTWERAGKISGKYKGDLSWELGCRHLAQDNDRQVVEWLYYRERSWLRRNFSVLSGIVGALELLKWHAIYSEGENKQKIEILNQVLIDYPGDVWAKNMLNDLT